ncbi:MULTISPECIES: polysaccharide lyase family 7 protein [unclassified Vibrio]|uniref:Polysaccharide lyase family 7 protein n=1 Tax=Vibrio sp. HB236076 TaxID=3232307 RepID=A0AB39HCP3_9VIBR|nr:polysaccharide lyase family 7 protein [Vibrio sp. HB161653]MDP5254654.1 polysaccharide lyase family 7 protein [Vibrio sp. HB161653]
MKTPTLLSFAVLCSLSAPVLSSTDTRAPGQQFNMNNWKITLPQDINKDGRVDEIEGVAMLTYSNDDFFHLDDQGHLVFEVQNQAITTKNSKNARSELRQMARGADFSIGTHDAKNNWALSSHPQADTFSAIGGTLEATLKVNHVSLHAKYPEKYPAFSVVVGQIHAEKDKQQIKDKSGFGHGNEPLKIFYKKFPGHNTGSVFWNYERNLAKNDPNRMDIAYPVWGNTWENPNDPGNQGVALGESFSYKVDVKGSIMHLTFTSDKHKTVTYEIDLSKGVDDKDYPQGYAKDAFYFKAGAYGQCSVSETHPVWGPGCQGTGDFTVDKANGDYNSVTFSQLKLNGQ